MRRRGGKVNPGRARGSCIVCLNFLTSGIMLAKLTTKNPLTLPRRALAALGPGAAPTYFEVEAADGRLILTPARIGSADAVRRKRADLGITEADVADAVARARRAP